MFNVQGSMFKVQCSMFNVQISMFKVQCSKGMKGGEGSEFHMRIRSMELALLRLELNPIPILFKDLNQE